MTDEHAQVVISGAGPNGLMLACELALTGIRPVVLDVLSGPSLEPKANGLVGQVIRILDQRGLYQTFSGDDGPPKPSPGWMFAAMPLSFGDLDPNPMYALRIPQPRLVRLLEKRARDLGVDLRWGHELTGLSAGPDPNGSFMVLRGRDRAHVVANPFSPDAAPNGAIGVATITAADDAVAVHQRVAETAWREALKGDAASSRVRELVAEAEPRIG